MSNEKIGVCVLPLNNFGLDGWFFVFSTDDTKRFDPMKTFGMLHRIIVHVENFIPRPNSPFCEHSRVKGMQQDEEFLVTRFSPMHGGKTVKGSVMVGIPEEIDEHLQNVRLDGKKSDDGWIHRIRTIDVPFIGSN